MMNLKDLFGLQGRVALVTGGSRGIGKMIVEGLLEAGCERVYISARKVHEIEETCAELGEKVIGIPADLSQMDGIQRLADELASREDKLDLLVNNAGAAWGEPFDEFTEAGWDRTMDLNVKTPFFLTQKLHGLLKAAGTPERPAKVLMIASIDGMKSNPWPTYPYQASKAGLIHLTRRMAAELVGDNIIIGGWASSIFVVGVETEIYVTQTVGAIVEKDLFTGMVKSVFFGIAICWVGVYRGFQVEGGAEGVGRQTTASVVTSIFLIIIVDLVFTVLFYYL